VSAAILGEPLAREVLLQPAPPPYSEPYARSSLPVSVDQAQAAHMRAPEYYAESDVVGTRLFVV